MTDVWASVGEVVRFLDDHQGALMVVTTVAYATLTLLLLVESRSARFSAGVVVWPTRWRWNETAMAVYLENTGPAPAIDVELSFGWRGQDGPAAAERVVRHPALAPGERIPYMPDTLLGDEIKRGIDGAANAQLSLDLKWAWRDGRRRILWRGYRRHSRSLKVDLAAFKASVHREPNLIEPDPLERLAEVVRSAASEADARQRFSEMDKHMPPEVRAHVEAMRMRQRWELWKARFRYWVLKRRT